MTRKLIILFLVLMLVTASLISSFLGERGIIVNNQLKRQLKSNEYELDRSDMEIENLRLQDQELSTEDGSRSTAMSFGYQVEGDDVHVFETEDVVKDIPASSNAQERDEKEKQFKPWSISFILLISFCSSIIITLIVWLFTRNKGDSDDSQQEESGNFGNNFNID
ncbi:MAG: hypothetical protein IJL13_01210 [Spirochaetales bacterium]|nr:hypothetical protein [Spirochaetales bacterium]MBQ6123998.1 hypothetical protein [Spirochaetales bacterium]